MVQANGSRALEQRVMKLRVGRSKYSTRFLASSKGLSAARRAMPISLDSERTGLATPPSSLFLRLSSRTISQPLSGVGSGDIVLQLMNHMFVPSDHPLDQIDDGDDPRHRFAVKHGQVADS